METKKQLLRKVEKGEQRRIIVVISFTLLVLAIFCIFILIKSNTNLQRENQQLKEQMGVFAQIIVLPQSFSYWNNKTGIWINYAFTWDNETIKYYENGIQMAKFPINKGNHNVLSSEVLP